VDANQFVGDSFVSLGAEDGTEDRARILLKQTSISGLFEIVFRPFRDARGTLTRVFSPESFAPTELFPDGPVHINIVTTHTAGTVRGLHWQEGSPESVGEAKIVTCIAGRVFDVAVDLRPNSETRFEHHAIELTPDSGRGLLIPAGVAHGMQSLKDDSALLYLHAAAFVPECERGARVDDPLLSIPWPLPLRNLSERDRGHPLLDGTAA